MSFIHTEGPAFTANEKVLKEVAIIGGSGSSHFIEAKRIFRGYFKEILAGIAWSGGSIVLAAFRLHGGEKNSETTWEAHSDCFGGRIRTLACRFWTSCISQIYHTTQSASDVGAQHRLTWQCCNG